MPGIFSLTEGKHRDLSLMAQRHVAYILDEFLQLPVLHNRDRMTFLPLIHEVLLVERNLATKSEFF